MIKAILISALVATMLVGAGDLNAKDNPVIVMETTEGPVTIELYPDKAPITVQNFMWYVDHEFFDGLIFHRVIKDFMIQGGGFSKDMVKKAGNPPIDNEAGNGLTNDKYTIAMARTNAIHSATAQFFINTKDNDFLNHRDNTSKGFGYCVFGKVIDGTDAVDAINTVPTTNKNGMADVPKSTVMIKKVYGKEASAKDKKAKKSE